MTNTMQHHNHFRQHHCSRRPVDIIERLPAVEKYAYCLCLHVKPTTIFIAVIKLIKTLALASFVLNSEFAIPDSGDHSIYLRQKSTAAALTILMLIIMASVSAVGIYAVLSGRAALLMPLCAIMLCDFLFSLPAVYHRDPDPIIGDQTFKEYITNGGRYDHNVQANNRYSVNLVSILLMITRVFFLCVIWNCYRYLRLRELILPLRIAAEIYPHIGQVGPHPIVRVIGNDSGDLTSVTNVAPPPYDAIVTSMKTQPPNYEEAMKATNISLPESLIINPTPQDQQSTEEQHQPQIQFAAGREPEQLVNNTDQAIQATQTGSSSPLPSLAIDSQQQ